MLENANPETISDIANASVIFSPSHNNKVSIKISAKLGGQTRTLSRHEHLFYRGDQLTSLVLIRSGTIKVYEGGNDSHEQVFGFGLPGDIVGLDAIEDGYHRCAAVALETCGVVELPMDRLEARLQTMSDEQRLFYQLLLQAICTHYCYLRLFAQKGAEQRLASFLLDLSERFAARGFSASEFNLSMSRRDIGSHLGLAAATLSRLLARFRDQGLLNVQQRHVKIHDVDALRERVQCGVYKDLA